MPSAKYNSTMHKATSLIFVFDITSPWDMFANCSMYNTHIMDLPLSSSATQFF